MATWPLTTNRLTLGHLQDLYDAINCRITTLGVTWAWVSGFADPGPPVAGQWRDWYIYQKAVCGMVDASRYSLADHFCLDPTDDLLPRATGTGLAVAAGYPQYPQLRLPRCATMDDVTGLKAMLDLLIYPRAKLAREDYAFGNDPYRFGSSYLSAQKHASTNWADMLNAAPSWVGQPIQFRNVRKEAVPGQLNYRLMDGALVLMCPRSPGYYTRGVEASWINQLTAGRLRLHCSMENTAESVELKYISNAYRQDQSPVTFWNEPGAQILVIPPGNGVMDITVDVTEMAYTLKAVPSEADPGELYDRGYVPGPGYDYDNDRSACVLTEGITWTPF